MAPPPWTNLQPRYDEGSSKQRHTRAGSHPRLSHTLSRRNEDAGRAAGTLTGCLIGGLLLLAVAYSCFDYCVSGRAPPSGVADKEEKKNHHRPKHHSHHGHRCLSCCLGKPGPVRKHNHRRKKTRRDGTVQVSFFDIPTMEYPILGTTAPHHPEAILQPMDETIHERDFAQEYGFGETFARGHPHRAR